MNALKIIFISCCAVWNSAACATLPLSAAPRVLVTSYSASSHENGGFIKWDCPVLAIYADGTTIWRRNWEASIGALRVTDGGEGQAIAGKVEALVQRYGGREYVLTTSSEPDVTTIWTNHKRLTIYGDWRKPRVLESTGSQFDEAVEVNKDEKKLWGTLPPEVRLMLLELITFNSENARQWRPERLRLLLQPAIKTVLNAIPWPSRWPQAFRPASSTGAMKFIELPGTMLDELLQVIPDDGEPKIVSLGGNKHYADLHLVFPGQADGDWSPIPRVKRDSRTGSGR